MVYKDIIQENETIIDLVHDRLYKKNQNFLAVFSGPTGSGKTYSALKFAELIDPNFTADNVVFSAKEFIDKVNDPNTKKGTCIIFDEAGVDYDRRNWHSFTNQALNHITQSFRYRNLAIIYTVPSMSFIDKTAQKLLHMYFETQKINRSQGYCTVKPFFIIYNPRMGENVYFKYPRVRYTRPNGYKYIGILKKINFTKAKSSTLRDYEKRRAVWADEKYKEIQEQLELFGAVAGKVSNKIYQEIKTEILENPEKYVNYNRKRKEPFLVIARISQRLHTSTANAKKIIQHLTEDKNVSERMHSYVRQLQTDEKLAKETEKAARLAQKHRAFIGEAHMDVAMKKRMGQLLDD